MELSWQMLEIARVAYGKAPASSKVSRQLSLVYTRLGDLSQCNDQFEQAVHDYKTALEIWERLGGQDMDFKRGLCSKLLDITRALQYSSSPNFAQALTFAQRALTVFEELLTSESAADKKAELSELRTDVSEKVSELEQVLARAASGGDAVAARVGSAAEAGAAGGSSKAEASAASVSSAAASSASSSAAASASAAAAAGRTTVGFGSASSSSSSSSRGGEVSGGEGVTTIGFGAPSASASAGAPKVLAVRQKRKPTAATAAVGDAVAPAQKRAAVLPAAAAPPLPQKVSPLSENNDL
eukprot:SAG11_NODE_919_length_6545_cov_5.571052_5_plen_298_part_00